MYLYESVSPGFSGCLGVVRLIIAAAVCDGLDGHVARPSALAEFSSWNANSFSMIKYISWIFLGYSRWYPYSILYNLYSILSCLL